MSKIWFAGDMHLSEKCPSSRIDDYPMSMLKKLKALVDMVGPTDIVIQTGDFTDRPHLPAWYTCEIINILAPLRGRFYAIFGNHEPPKGSSRGIADTALMVLIRAGVVQHLDVLEFEGFHIRGFDYHDDITDKAPEGKPSIYVVHRFIFDRPDERIGDNEILYKEDILDLAPTMVVGGHDHCIYETVRWGKTFIVRPGAFSRGTIHGYNKVREIFVSSVDTSNGNLETHNVPCLPPSEIFKDVDISVTVAQNRLDAFIEMLSSTKSTLNSSVDEILQGIEMPQEVEAEVRRYLLDGGIQIRAEAQEIT